MQVLDPVEAVGKLPVEGAFDRATLAYHEAGHAVVAHLLGWRLVSVTINDQGGCCASRPGLRVRSRPLSGAALQRDRQRMAADTTRSNVTIMLAGPVSEQLATGRMHSATILERDAAVALARREERRVSADRCWKAARRFLLRHWAAVEALAQALLER